MANGKTHSIISTVVAIPATVLTLGLGVDIALVVGGGCLTGILLTPDLDLNRTMPWGSNQLKRWVPWLFVAWSIFWLPYRKLVPHRSWISHSFISSTVIRVLYLSILFLPLIHPFIPRILSSPYFWAFLGGLAVSDGFHIAVDRW